MDIVAIIILLLAVIAFSGYSFAIAIGGFVATDWSLMEVVAIIAGLGRCLAWAVNRLTPDNSPQEL